MKRMKPLWLLSVLIIIISVLAGCGSKELAWDTFEGAVNEKSFPVPKEANSSDRATTNVAMDYVRYSLPGLKEKEGVPEPYLDAIEAWGWTEKKVEDAGVSRIFEKDGMVIHLTVHDGYFTVMVPKEKKAAIKGLQTK
ncbi:hypothetical protein [Paenibacillus sp. NFR01]|uniref:hypothetical protein n=1 Tax=Paenibacillus sp. NFR01 TaxID=1566279 RepID=UPI0008B0A1C8|nr:hypothetical protein [Paenibacillus sp. NFR01]SEU31680.1 hypothetical protein SAMN03159358_0064 [Paenibacillus sp. NFR01]